MQAKFLENEFWYGGAVYESYKQPIGEEDSVEWDFRENPTANQIMPLFLSTKGRYIWSEKGFQIQFHKGMIQAEGDCEILLKEGYDSLRGAYLEAMKQHFPFHEIRLSKRFFEAPVYNTWIEMTFYQEQNRILEYARGILEHGLPTGILMIDDGWSPYYGKWQFRKDNFPEARKMIEELHEMGFQVMLWICPFITPDTVEYRETRDRHLLIETPEGKPRILEWWNGYSAALDLTNPKALEWLKGQLDVLQEMGIDGFKFDAGDSYYYTEGDRLFKKANTDELSRLWAAFGEQYAFNELRVCFKTGGYSLMQRLCDKHHTWDERGVGGLIPGMLLQGMTGHPFGSPDMIGGGEYISFQENSGKYFDAELFVRYCEIAALMPVMQFSAAPWRLLGEEDYEKVLAAMRVREKYLPVLLETVQHAYETGEPVVRHMEYVFPGQGMEKTMNQFMIGDKLLVAPVTEKGAASRSVRIPRGRWKLEDKILESNGEEQVLDSRGGLLVLESIDVIKKDEKTDIEM